MRLCAALSKGSSMWAYSLRSVDFFNQTMMGAASRFRGLPKRLPWFEPSINMPFLDACAAHVFGQHLASILTTAVLVEHALRIAVVDVAHGGRLSSTAWRKLSGYSIRDFVEKEKLAPQEKRAVDQLIHPDDRPWWTDVANAMVRNKVAHLDVPTLITKLGNHEPYVGSYQDGTEKEVLLRSRRWWGAFFHKTDSLVAAGFLKDARHALAALAERAGWSADRSNWAAQEGEYDSFFAYDWSLENMGASTRRIVRSTKKARLRTKVGAKRS
jgi:hypothetical protein